MADSGAPQSIIALTQMHQALGASVSSTAGRLPFGFHYRQAASWPQLMEVPGIVVQLANVLGAERATSPASPLIEPYDEVFLRVEAPTITARAKTVARAAMQIQRRLPTGIA